LARITNLREAIQDHLLSCLFSGFIHKGIFFKGSEPSDRALQPTRAHRFLNSLNCCSGYEGDQTRACELPDGVQTGALLWG
jgi:hypothetical protein